MELEKVKNRGFSKLKLIVWLCLAVLFCGGVYFAWGWGRIEFHAQRLGASDREVALASELALLTLGEPGRDVLYDFLLNKRNIKLPPLSLESGAQPKAGKIIAISESGEVEVAGAVGPTADVVVLADSSAPVAKVCRPLSELARVGTVRALAAVLTPDSEMAALEIDLVFQDTARLESYLTLRVGETQANLEGAPVARPDEVAAILKDKAPAAVRIMPKAGVRYARFLRFAYYLHAAGRRPVLVFGDAGAFGAPSPVELEDLSRSLGSPEESRQVRAAVRLKTAFGELFGYDTSKPPAQNRAAIESWLKWLEKNRDYIYFDTVTGRYAYDPAAGAAGVGHRRYWMEKLRILQEQPISSDGSKEE